MIATMRTQHTTHAAGRDLTCEVWRSETTGLYLAACPSLDLMTQGRTPEEARRAIDDGVRVFVKACLTRGLPLP